MSRHGERGQTMLLIVGLAVVLMTAVAIVVNASAAYLQRQGLDSLADGAALVGADAGAEGQEVYTGGLGAERLQLFEDEAREAVDDYLIRTGARNTYPGLGRTVAVDPESRTVRIRLTAALELPLTIPGAPERATIIADAAAAVTPD